MLFSILVDPACPIYCAKNVSHPVSHQSLVQNLVHGLVHGLVQCRLHAFTDVQSAYTACREHVETTFSSVELCDLA